VNNNQIPTSRGALRKLLIVLAVVAGVMLYAYGWRVTDISLDETQDETRQTSVTRALRELLSPNVFDQDRDSEFVDVNFAIGCPEDGAPIPQPEPGEGEPYIEISPDCGERDEVVTITGHHFHANADAFVRWIPPGGQSRPMVRTDVDSEGYFQTAITVPSLRGGGDEYHTIEVEGSWPEGLPHFSETTETVIEKMVETIFLALMATTLAVPIAFVLSFFAARNLMRQVRLPVGDVLIAFILLPVGWLLGDLLLRPIGELGVRWGKELVMGIIGPAIAMVAYGGIARAASTARLPEGTPGHRARKIALNVLLVAVIIFTLGALGGIGIWVGEKLEDGLLADLGNFINTLGTLVDLSIAVAAALAGALLVSSIGTSLTRGGLRYFQGPSDRILGAVLGLASGTLLMALMAVIANQAAWFGLLPLLVAVILAMQVLGLIYNHLTGAGHRDEANTHATLRLVLQVVVAVAVFYFAYLFLDSGRLIVDGRLPAALKTEVGPFSVKTYTFRAMLMGAVLGAIGGWLMGIHRPFPLGMTIYNTTRTILNALRSIEPLIMGIVFVIWVGIGPFAGVLALMLHSIAALGKLYSEQVENIDPGPIEAVQATGATRLQTIAYGVVPQIVPPYIAFTMYRWDINVRMSTIIGFVGGGGIGFLLQQQINLLRYREAGVAVLAIAIVVSVLDYASASIRERMI